MGAATRTLQCNCTIDASARACRGSLVAHGSGRAVKRRALAAAASAVCWAASRSARTCTIVIFDTFLHQGVPHTTVVPAFVNAVISLSTCSAAASRWRLRCRNAAKDMGCGVSAPPGAL